MFKFPIAAAIGLSAVVSAAYADTIVVQSGPRYDPAHVVPTHATPADGYSVLNAPGFERLAEMCSRMGMDCSAPGAGLHADTAPHPHPLLSPEARADAEKRLDLLRRVWEDYAADMEEHFETLPAPTHPRPHLLFGWNAPRVVPFPRVIPNQFGYRFPTTPHTTLPRLTLPRATVPHIGGLSGFTHRLNNPSVVPLGVFPRGGFPRGAFPRHTFRGGSVFPWPSL